MRGEENEEENETAKRRKRNDDDDVQITCAPEEEEEEEEEELLKRGRPLAWGVAKTRTPFREVRFEEGRQYECRIPSLLAAFEQIEQKLKNEKPISTDPKTFDPDTILKIDEDCSEKAISLGYKLGTIKHSAYALLAMAGPGGMKAANIVSIAKRLDLYNPGTCKTPNGSVTAVLSQGAHFQRIAPGRYALKEHVTDELRGGDVWHPKTKETERDDVSVIDLVRSGQLRPSFRGSSEAVTNDDIVNVKSFLEKNQNKRSLTLQETPEVVQRGRRGVDSFGREIWHSLVVSFESAERASWQTVPRTMEPSFATGHSTRVVVDERRVKVDRVTQGARKQVGGYRERFTRTDGKFGEEPLERDVAKRKDRRNAERIESVRDDANERERTNWTTEKSA